LTSASPARKSLLTHAVSSEATRATSSSPATLEVARIDAKAPVLTALRSRLDSWRGIGVVERGMAGQGYDLQLTRYYNRGWRATLYTTGGAFADERNGHRLGAHAVARGPGQGAGRAEERRAQDVTATAAESYAPSRQ
jgi:hypothetical protein